MPLPLGVQLYTFRDPARFGGAGLGLDIETLEKVAAAGLSGVETVNVPGDDPVVARKVLADLGLAVTSSHAWIDLDDPSSVARSAESLAILGSPRMIVSHAPFADIAEVDAFVDKAAAAAEVATEHGLRFGYHNHANEVKSILGGVSPLERLATRLGDAIDLQVDIFWVAVGGAEPASVIRDLGDRVVSLHVKDGIDLPSEAYGGEQFVNVPVGTGVVDPGPAVAAAEATGSVEWLIVEFDYAEGSAIEAVAASAANLFERGLARRRSA